VVVVGAALATFAPIYGKAFGKLFQP
jgi:hypothetical protein